MKQLIALLCLLATLALTGCYKEHADSTNYTVPFTLLNGMAASGMELYVVTGPSPRPFNQKIVAHFYSDDGMNITGLWQYGLSSREPSLVQVYGAMDTTRPFFSQLIPAEPGVRHNLLVTGTPEAPAYLYLADHPATPTDSTAGIRFVNLCRELDHLSVNIVGQAPGSEAADVPYLQASAFKRYNARQGQSQYLFELVDKTTGEVVFFYPFNTIPFTNVNICLRGLRTDWPELQVTTVNQ